MIVSNRWEREGPNVKGGSTGMLYFRCGKP